MVARYACDAKYEDDQAPCSPGSKPFVRWLSRVNADDGTDLFDTTTGGGPGGREWNPSAALVVFVDAPAGNETVSLRVGARRYQPAERRSDDAVFYVPRADWERAERELRRNEMTWERRDQRDALRVAEVTCTYDDGRWLGRLFAFGRGE